MRQSTARKRVPEPYEVQHARNVRRYYRLKGLGICVDCGVASAKRDRVRCKRCLDDAAERWRRSVAP